jgi:hypothetical protein
MDGKAKARTPNWVATRFARRCGLQLMPDDIMVGTVMVLGVGVSAAGDETAVTDEALAVWQQLIA